MELPFFFILGRPRSGTTLLKALFDAHPNVKIPPELPVLLPLYQKFRHVRSWDEQQILTFVDHVFKPDAFNNKRIENLRIDREQFTRDLLQLGKNCTIQDLLVKLNEHSFSVFPKQEILLVGDKNPVYSICLKRLARIFPQARFICIVRDYRDNYISIRNLEEVKMEAPVLTLQVARWVYVTKLFLAARKKFPGRFYIIRYEDLVTKPQGSFREICAFLSIPYVPEVFEFYKKKDELMKSFQHPLMDKIHKSLMEPVNTGRMELWKAGMTEREVKTAGQIAGKTADLMGYSRDAAGFSMAIYLNSLPMTIYAKTLFRLIQWNGWLPYPICRWVSLQLPKLARIYGRFSGK